MTNKKLTKNNQQQLVTLLVLILGLKYHLEGFYKIAKKTQTLLSLLSCNFLGLNHPVLPQLLEALVNAIPCQKISLETGL